MKDLNELLSVPPTTAATLSIWGEHPNGFRQLIATAAGLPNAKKGVKDFVDKWVAQSNKHAPHTAVMPDELTAVMSVAGQVVTVIYVEPMPERPKHPGDVRVDRKTSPRKAVRRT